MNLKTSTFAMARSAIFKHSAALTAQWGEMEQDEDGTVSFSTPPETLETLRVEPKFKKRWMGGTCAMNFKFSHQLICRDNAKLTFKGSREGHFTGRTNGSFSSSLLDALNADTRLKVTLRAIDLDKLTIDIGDECVETILTPYGGGLAYLVIPPMRTLIPLPSDQIDSLSWALERIGKIIDSIKGS